MNITINGVSITLTSEQIQQIDAEIKKNQPASKPTPEERFWQLCNGLEIKIDLEKYPNTIFFFKGEDLWFEYEAETGYLWCRYLYVWSVFEKEYGMNYSKIKSLIKKQVENHFKCKEVTPIRLQRTGIHPVENHFKCKI